MDATAAGIRLASAVVGPLIKKLLRTEGEGAGLVDRPQRISSYVSWREKRDLDAADLRKLADRLVREALRAPGERPLPPGEEAGVAAALAATLHALGDLTLSDVDAVRLGPEAFARRLRAAAPHPGLSRDAELFHDRLVELACLHILNFFTQRSTFVAATLVEQSMLHAATIAKVDELLTRLPRQDGRDTAFEERYLSYVARRHNALTIFGLDLPPDSTRWPLDAAYVSLEAAAPAHTTEPAGAVAPAPTPYLLPADRLLADHPRTLLRGEAGSGKTTLIQWLAVTAARGTRGGAVPYVLPLRTLTRHGERLPAPGAFLTSTGFPLADEAPGGWEGRVLRDGRALLLVDGIDEIPEAERARARDWLTDLITAFPGNRWLVTSRPSAVRHDWLAGEGFAEVALTPMSRANVQTFVERWHAAAEAPADHAERLLDSLRAKPDLARLTGNPLLCGMICALHRERRGFLPTGRKELYAAALTMLLDRRDRERGLRLPSLAEEPQLQLLQRLAHWLNRNGRTEMDRSRAEALIGDALPAVPAARVLGGAYEVYQHFLERTGLLRAPTVGTVQFVHRTFQDYLGARSALDEGGLGELTRHADDDQWEDVIRMAVALGRPRERTAILNDLLVRGSHRALLLAYTCLEEAAELEPELREDVLTAARTLVPPTSGPAAAALGRVGPLILEVLPGPADVTSAEQARLTVIAAGGVGSDRAIPFLARYADHPSLAVQEELCRLWPRFDAVEYAQEVLARMHPAPSQLTVESDERLAALSGFTGPPGLFVRQGVSRGALARFLRRQPVAELTLDNFSGGSDAEFLRDHSTLRRLEIRHWPALLDLGALYGLPLEEASLFLGNGQDVGSATASWPRLRALTLAGDIGRWSFHCLHPDAQIQQLEVENAPGDLAGLGRLRTLRLLEFGHDWRPAGPAAWHELSRLDRLEELVVHDAALEGLLAHARLPALRTLRLYGEDELTPELEERLALCFPGAEVEPYTLVFEQ
ncbi:NACHT domain-containing protein [Streptomyces erythrochromogenes]|uniref:NACHT domain-containing protein n=1 Tax=Streptomyces erythrochromogenes TaxID=285574 RepID=UPI0036B8B2BC